MLNREQIKKLILEKKLIEDLIDLDTQLTPNGFDLTVDKIYEFTSSGSLDFSNTERVVSEAREITPEKKNPDDKYGWWHLEKGVYKIKTNETFNLPKDLMGIAFTRSSLLRMGAYTQVAAWEAGFIGKAEFILVVENPNGIFIKQNAKITQLLFSEMEETENGYDGVYKHLK